MCLKEHIQDRILKTMFLEQQVSCAQRTNNLLTIGIRWFSESYTIYRRDYISKVLMFIVELKYISCTMASRSNSITALNM
jgi:hypothetical protein